jgi:hypothetical protein
LTPSSTISTAALSAVDDDRRRAAGNAPDDDEPVALAPRRQHKAERVRERVLDAALVDEVREAPRSYLQGVAPPKPRSLGLGEDDGLAARDSEAWLESAWSRR